MTTIHTYTTTQGTVETRTSRTRAYAACLVATVTEAVRAGWTAKKEAEEATLVTLRAELAALVVARSQTVEQAQAQHKVETDNPRGDGKCYFHSLWDLRDGITAEWGYTEENRWKVRNEAEAEAKVRLAAQGVQDPWREDGPNALVTLDHRVRSSERTIKYLATKLATQAVGHEEVLSWHLSLSNAQKALGTPAPAGQKAKPKRNRYGGESRLSDADHYRNDGYAVRVETSFETRETKPRTKAA